jgi:hypothetical protein
MAMRFGTHVAIKLSMILRERNEFWGGIGRSSGALAQPCILAQIIECSTAHWANAPDLAQTKVSAKSLLRVSRSSFGVPFPFNFSISVIRTSSRAKESRRGAVVADNSFALMTPKVTIKSSVKQSAKTREASRAFRCRLDASSENRANVLTSRRVCEEFGVVCCAIQLSRSQLDVP